MVLERTSVGLDVRARSVVAGCWTPRPVSCARGGCRWPTEAVVGWIGSLPGPVLVCCDSRWSTVQRRRHP